MYLPGVSEVIGSLDEQRCWSEGFERHDRMGEMELGFEIQLDADFFFTVL